MKINQIVETPLADYEPIGDFEKPGSFTTTKYDAKLATNDINVAKAKKFFANTEYELRLYPVNKPGLRKYSEHGEISPAELVKIIPEAERIINSPDAEDTITVFYVSNTGTGKVPFTPWIMAHRLGHVIRGGMGKREYMWEEYEKMWWNTLSQICTDAYDYSIPPNSFMREQKSGQVACAISNTLGTMRSARKGLINRPYEFLYEMFAQYLNAGELKFNPIPQQLGFGRKAWGNSTNGLYNRDKLMLEEINGRLEYDFKPSLEYAIDSVLGTSYNKYYIM